MINYIDISTFTGWFINQFVSIGTQIINMLDNIRISNNVSILDFIIAIAIIGAFLPIVITAARNTARETIRQEKRKDKK